MEIKKLVQDKFIEMCKEVQPELELLIEEGSDTKASFEFSYSNIRCVQAFIAWPMLVDMIASRELVEDYLEDLFQEDDEELEDPFSSGELVFDDDGRVHFASDLRD